MPLVKAETPRRSACTSLVFGTSRSATRSSSRSPVWPASAARWRRNTRPVERSRSERQPPADLNLARRVQLREEDPSEAGGGDVGADPAALHVVQGVKGFEPDVERTG